MISSVAEVLAANPNFKTQLEAKRRQRAKDESIKPLEAYRAEELERMKLNFYGFDPSYHVARYNFVFRVPHSWTPLHLARHRQRIKNASPSDADASDRAINAARKPAPAAG
jgi:putative two-component system hydrogenase maturation factor HypX/HoxX